MARIDITPDGIEVRVEGRPRLLGRWRPLVVPRAHLRAVYADERAGGSFPGLRWGVSSYVPGVLALGSFRSGGRLSFWDVRDPAHVIVVELADEKYARLVVEVDDPAATVAAITALIGDGDRRTA
ncbi:hypothetical protein ACIQNU_02975 [Streptomyces sp. NPDC091292]|uniref:hypothetical protein n=1 Tax=Streptomyces sp. NPDC091292 TaxID=3365991 RepID=UPI0037F3BDD0